MFNSPTYRKFKAMIMQYIPDECQTRLMNMTLLMAGILASKSVHLNQVAAHLPIRAKKLSLAKRLERFVNNKAVNVKTWYRPWATQLIETASSGGQLHLVMDSTKVSAHCRLVMVAVAYHRRSLPLIWTWVEHSRGHCQADHQVKVLKELRAMIPDHVQVSLVGDSEFGTVKLIAHLTQWKWDYTLRQKGRTLLQNGNDQSWRRLDSYVVERNRPLYLPTIFLTKAHAYPTHVVIYWRQGETAPWYLATNQPSAFRAIRLYKRRVWIEEMFGDMKGHGFDLERSRLRTPERLSRLMLAVAILYLWLVSTGEFVFYFGFSDEIDRTDRRDLSLFRLGWDWLIRRFTFADPFPVIFCPDFSLVSGC